MIKLVLPYPISTNRYWRHWRGRPVRSKEAGAYCRIVKEEAKKLDISVCNEAVAVKLTLLPKMKKDGTASAVVLDLDNCCKVGLDSLNGIVYQDDKLIKSLSVEYGEPVAGGGLVVEVKKWELKQNILAK